MKRVAQKNKATIVFSPAEMDGRWNMEQWREACEKELCDELTLRWMFETAIGDGT